MLKNRRQFPPGGFVFFEPKTGWRSTPGFTFEQTVDEIARHRFANPRFASQWNMDTDLIADELDNYTCVRIGMDPNYCTGGAPSSVPFVPSLPSQPLRLAGANARVVGGVRKTIAGIGVVLDWLGAGGKAVPSELSDARAKVCAVCIKNQPADWKSFFTEPVARRLEQQLEVANQMKLSTSQDEKLHVCDACWCFMRLKVHTPLKHIVAHLKPEAREQLDPKCWILKESRNETPATPQPVAGHLES